MSNDLGGRWCSITNDFCLTTLTNAIKSNGIEKVSEKHKKPETVIGTLSGWGDNGGKGEIVAKIVS